MHSVILCSVLCYLTERLDNRVRKKLMVILVFRYLQDIDRVTAEHLLRQMPAGVSERGGGMGVDDVNI